MEHTVNAYDNLKYKEAIPEKAYDMMSREEVMRIHERVLVEATEMYEAWGETTNIGKFNWIAGILCGLCVVSLGFFIIPTILYFIYYFGRIYVVSTNKAREYVNQVWLQYLSDMQHPQES
ncbi:hypothetical protein EalM132_00188 [Exiguobacterium phage vB_EalM-132]|nr:hypothetical protein EalM132_00018 [Exiguobacterium phage vB_EalM-132]AYP68700.1 hypothetical protein EalM132_00188 [Exiguobacterium phage vB_EalM-132]